MSDSQTFNFDQVEEAREKVMTSPGTIGVFDISNVKFDASEVKGTYYMGLTFSRKEDEFSHRFYMSEKALPRVQTAAKAVLEGKKIEGNMSEEMLRKTFHGKKIALKVTARIDEENGRAYPDLSFGGFAKAASKLSELEFTEKEAELNSTALKMAVATAQSAADTPAGAAKEEEDPFSNPGGSSPSDV